MRSGSTRCSSTSGGPGVKRHLVWVLEGRKDESCVSALPAETAGNPRLPAAGGTSRACSQTCRPASGARRVPKPDRDESERCWALGGGRGQALQTRSRRVEGRNRSEE